MNADRSQIDGGLDETTGESTDVFKHAAVANQLDVLRERRQELQDFVSHTRHRLAMLTQAVAYDGTNDFPSDAASVNSDERNAAEIR